MLIALAPVMGSLLGGLLVRRRAAGPAPAGWPERSRDGRTLVAAEPPQRGTVTSAGPREPVQAIGYVSIPKADADRALLDEQASAIEHLCRKRGWELLHVVRDVENGHPKGLERPGLQYALERMTEGKASCLIVSELERLSRSAADLQIVWGRQRLPAGGHGLAARHRLELRSAHRPHAHVRGRVGEPANR